MNQLATRGSRCPSLRKTLRRLLVSVVLLGGCRASSSPPDTAPKPASSASVETSIAAQSKALLFFTDPTENVLIATRLQQHVSTCVRSQGFKFFEQKIGDKPLLDLSTALPISMGDRDSLKSLGFGLSTILSDDSDLQSGPKTADSEENRYLTSLSAGEQVARGEVVVGCYSKAFKAEFGDSPISSLASRDVVGDAIESITSDDGYVSSLAAWSKCLKRQGVEAQNELGLKNLIEKQVRESRGDKVTVLADGSLEVVIGKDSVTDEAEKKRRFDRMRKLEFDQIRIAVTCAEGTIKPAAETIRTEVLTGIATGTS